MACERLGGRKYLLRSRPPYSAHGCAWQEKTGNDGKMYTSVPNDHGQFVWVVIPPKIPLMRKAGFLAKAGYVLAAKLVLNKLTGNANVLDKSFPSGVNGHPWSTTYYAHNPNRINKSDKSLLWFLKTGATKIYRDHVAS